MKPVQPNLILLVNNSQGFVVTLEGTSLFLTILISSCALLGIFIKIITKFNSITAEIRDLREDLGSHSKAEGHQQLLEQTRIIQKDLINFDKKFDLHLQDYQHYKDANLLAYNGINEKINHTWSKTEKLFIEHKGEIKELQQFLKKEQNFKIRG
ncbi:MAG: hypothetical protein V7K25_24535 [Nostoc sp.]|uniref:hypothetical protein n=1 Tax=Nostoc sp. TaxID=1180 RepID=UPI002FFA7C3F